MWGYNVEEAVEAETGAVVESGINDLYVLVKHTPELLVAHIALFVLLCYVAAALPPFRGLAFKLRCYCAGMIHFFACREATIGSTDRQHPSRLGREPELVEKEFIFIRHGESEWNEIFNRGKLVLLPKLVIGIIREFFCLPFKNKSIFLDSPLGATGIAQSNQLCSELRRNPALSILAEQGAEHDNSNKSVVVSSNLKRCVQTALLSLQPRLEKTKENVYIYSCLQEAARNVDTLALTAAQQTPQALDCPHEELLDGTYNFGSKRWHERAIKRMSIFLKFAFSREEHRIVVVGHSLWFKKFFQEYLDDTVQLPEDARMAKSKKLSNCGVVRFKIQRGTKTLVQTHRIVPESIKVLHGKWI